MNRAAQDHADDSGENGSVGIVDSNGSTMSDRIERYSQWEGQIGESCSYREIYDGGHEIVLALLIDDGVWNRGNRNNIFNPEFNYVGIGLAKHSVYGQICVMDYATSVTELPIKTKSTPKLSHDFKTSYRRSRLDRVEKSRPAYEVHKQPKEGDILDISQVPQSVRDHIKKKNLIESDIEIKFENGTYKITYNTPSYQLIKRSHITTETDKENIPKNVLPPNYNDFGRFREYERFGGLGDLEKFRDLENFKDDSKDDDEPKGYIEKNQETNITTINGKTTKNVVTTYKFADGSTKILNNTKIC